MSNLSVSRSIQFVSLDTHPANNALVVTYEILVSVIDQRTQRELSRRNKRDQMLVNLPSLANYTNTNSKTPAGINLQELRAEIVRKCPMLAQSEDIQLHLLYLISRQQSQQGAQERPQSSASVHRSRSGSRATSARRPLVGASERPGDVYAHLYLKELRQQQSSFATNKTEAFLQELDERLSKHEKALASSQSTREANFIDIQLERLYGALREKLSAMGNLRQLSREDAQLVGMSSNKLLICAMLRILRDLNVASPSCDKPTIVLGESILYCLLRLTSFQNVYLSMISIDDEPIQQNRNQSSSTDSSPTSVISVALNVLVQHVEGLKSISGIEQLLENCYYYTQSLLHLLINLFLLSNQQLSGEQQEERIGIEQRILAQTRPQFLDSLVQLFQLMSKFLSLELTQKTQTTTSSKLNITELTASLVDILTRLSIFKEFVCRLRASKNSALFLSALVNLLGTLQLSRPTTGNYNESDDGSSGIPLANSNQQTTKDNSNGTTLMNHVYELELSLLKLINNILFDSRLKVRLIKRNLLKCVLRYLVVFLAAARRRANGKQQTNLLLGPYNRSAILLVPFKGLYELSCEKSIRNELFKSRIVIKCLLEYLLSAAFDLASSLAVALRRRSVDGMLDNRRHVAPDRQVSRQNRRAAGSQRFGQILVEPNNVGHYIVALWINLSCCQTNGTGVDDGAKNEERDDNNDEGANESHRQQDTELQVKQSQPLIGIGCTGELRSYIELTTENLANLLVALEGGEEAETDGDDEEPVAGRQVGGEGKLQACKLMMLMHVKLLRNLTQMNDMEQEEGEDEDYVGRWCERLASATWRLIELARGKRVGHDSYNHSLTVESLASLSNLLRWRRTIGARSGEPANSIAGGQVMDLYERLLDRPAPFGRDLLYADGEENDSDDLLLVSLSFLANLAQTKEVCQSTLAAAKMARNFLELTNFILESKTGDRELVVGALFALCQLMNHCDYLNAFSDTGGRKENNASEATGKQSLSLKLADLLLTSDRPIGKLANFALNRLRQLDEQHNIEESLIYRERFACYNERWLAAIRASREDGLLEESATRQQQVNYLGRDGGNFAGQQQFSGVEQNLRAIGDHQSSGGSSGSEQVRRTHRMQIEDADDDDDEDEEDEDEEEDGDDDIAGENGGDLGDFKSDFDETDERAGGGPRVPRVALGVIDSQSMIKHLTEAGARRM